MNGLRNQVQEFLSSCSLSFCPPLSLSLPLPLPLSLSLSLIAPLSPTHLSVKSPEPVLLVQSLCGKFVG